MLQVTFLPVVVKIKNVTGSHILLSYFPGVPYEVGGRVVFLRRGTTGDVLGDLVVIFTVIFAIILFS